MPSIIHPTMARSIRDEELEVLPINVVLLPAPPLSPSPICTSNDAFALLSPGNHNLNPRFGVERSIVLFKPTNTPLYCSPSHSVVDYDLISSIKDRRSFSGVHDRGSNAHVSSSSPQKSPGPIPHESRWPLIMNNISFTGSPSRTRNVPSVLNAGFSLSHIAQKS